MNRVTDYLHALPTADYLRLRRDGVRLMKRDYLSILFLVSRSIYVTRLCLTLDNHPSSEKKVFNALRISFFPLRKRISTTD